jgi:pimeloyl-ACP methyl ester carboxylesterase
MGWKTMEIGGKDVDLFLPEQSPRGQFALVHLHGHSEKTLKDNPVYTAALEAHGLLCVCPHGKRSWWLNRVCTEFDAAISPQEYVLDTLIPWIESEWTIAPPAIGLAGISMGGQGALQLAYRYPRKFPVVAAIAPAVDFQRWFGQGLALDEMFATREAARQETVILQLHPLNWPRHQFLACDPNDHEWFESADKLSMKLNSSGIMHERDFQTSRGGHTWDYFEALADRTMGWVVEKLEAVARSI